jgi:hypothetical protein
MVVDDDDADGLSVAGRLTILIFYHDGDMVTRQAERRSPPKVGSICLFEGNAVPEHGCWSSHAGSRNSRPTWRAPGEDRAVRGVAPEIGLPRVEIAWTERELASLARLASLAEAAEPTDAPIRAMRD